MTLVDLENRQVVYMMTMRLGFSSSQWSKVEIPTGIVGKVPLLFTIFSAFFIQARRSL